MKFLVKIIAIIAIIHFGGWWYLTGNIKGQLTDHLNMALEQSNIKGRNISVDYIAKRAGYPLNIGVKLSDYIVTANDPNSDIKISITANGPITLLTTPWSYPQITSSFKNLEMVINVESAKQNESVSFVATIGSGNSIGELNQQHNTETTLNDIIFQENKTNQAVLVIDNFHINTAMNIDEYTTLVDSSVLMEIAGLDVISPETGSSKKIKNIAVNMRNQNCPQNTILREMLQEISTKKGQPIKTMPLKQELDSFIREMQRVNCRFYIDKLLVESGEIAVDAKAEIGIDPALRPEGFVTVRTKGLEAFAPIMQGMSGGIISANTPINISIKTKDGMLHVNGNPVLPVMPLPKLIATIPAEINTTPKPNITPTPNNMGGMR